MVLLKRLMRLVIPASGFLLTIVFVHSGTVEMRPPDALSADARLGNRSGNGADGRTSKPSVMSHVIAEGRVVAYPGAEVVVATEAAGRIVRLEVHEKSVLRKGDLIAELSADDLKADYALACARIMEAEAEIRFFDRELNREEILTRRRAGTPQNLDIHRRELEMAAGPSCRGVGRERSDHSAHRQDPHHLTHRWSHHRAARPRRRDSRGCRENRHGNRPASNPNRGRSR